jgi:hypothetical protein
MTLVIPGRGRRQPNANPESGDGRTMNISGFRGRAQLALRTPRNDNHV